MVIPDLQRIGKYDVLERIAAGGFATLYRGRDPFLKRLVAIKVCASDDPALRQQFLREAEIAGNLDHPAIVRSFDFGFDPVGPYLVQEYLQGEDLSQLIAARVPLSPRLKLDLLVQIAEGLAYSHRSLVLHLDVKPANVRVLGRRQAKILDFGIARLATADGAPAVPGMLGTAGYLPPEQVTGKPLDPRADVFAFGALAYELLTYTRPFSGATVSDLIKRVLSGEAEPIRRYWPDCSDALANLIGRCLRRDPGARYPSFDALLPELIAIRDGFPEVEEGELGPDPAAPPSAAPAAPPAAAAPQSRRLGKLVLRGGSRGAGAAAADPPGPGAAATRPLFDPASLAAGESAVGALADGGPVVPALAAPAPADPGAPEAAPLVVSAAAPEPPSAVEAAEPGAVAAPAPALEAPAAAAAAPRPARARGGRTLLLGLAAVAAAVVVAVVALRPGPEAVAGAAALASPSSTPWPTAVPGVVLLTASPWAEVTAITGADGSRVELPAERVTPVRVWLEPGRHQIELRVRGDTVVGCDVDVLEAATHLCHAASAGPVESRDYFKEMGWWQ